jgi:hypothetical protein
MSNFPLLSGVGVGVGAAVGVGEAGSEGAASVALPLTVDEGAAIAVVLLLTAVGVTGGNAEIAIATKRNTAKNLTMPDKGTFNLFSNLAAVSGIDTIAANRKSNPAINPCGRNILRLKNNKKPPKIQLPMLIKVSFILSIPSILTSHFLMFKCEATILSL